MSPTMSSLKQTLIKTGGLLAALAASDSSNVNVVTTDTLVIGGGAGGAHAAVRLTDYGQDVILVERQPILVGLIEYPQGLFIGRSY
jgi:heterodisulfide reductase subunit A-like polyferredoxin